MKKSITSQSISILAKLNERKSTGKNDVKCHLYQARHANNGHKIPAKTLMAALGGKFPKAYNSRVNKVYDWRHKRYLREGGVFARTKHQEYLKGGIDAPSLSSEYKEILAYEHQLYAYAEAYLKAHPYPVGIHNSKQLVARFISELEHDGPSDTRELIEKGKEILKTPNPSVEALNDFDLIIDSFEFQSMAIILNGSPEQKSRIKKIALRLIDET